MVNVEDLVKKDKVNIPKTTKSLILPGWPDSVKFEDDMEGVVSHIGGVLKENKVVYVNVPVHGWLPYNPKDLKKVEQ